MVYLDQVELLDTSGAVVGTKLRADIDRQNDILAAVYVFVCPAPGQVLLAVIPDDAYQSRGVYVGKIGFPVASFIRRGETALQAATRACQTDLGIEAGELRLVSEQYIEFSDGLKRQASVFNIMHPGPYIPHAHAAAHISTESIADLPALVQANPSAYAPSLIAFLPLITL